MNFGPHPFSFRQIQYAVAVAGVLSFRRAAELCGVSQPSLSTQISGLENALGVKIFERDRRRVLVTTAGREIIERARLLLLETDDLVSVARRSSDPLGGSLRIGVIPTISPYLLPLLTPALRAAFPRLTVFWAEDKTGILVERLDAGTLDAALLSLEAQIGDVEREVIAADPFVLVGSVHDPIAAGSDPVRLSELRDTGILLLDEGHCFGDQALALCSRAKAHNLEFRATSLSTIAEMVAGGAGITLLPALAVRTEARRKSLRVRSFADPVPGRTIGLIWRKRSHLGAALRKIAATIRQAYPVPAEFSASDRGRAPSRRLPASTIG